MLPDDHCSMSRPPTERSRNPLEERMQRESDYAYLLSIELEMVKKRREDWKTVYASLKANINEVKEKVQKEDDQALELIDEMRLFFDLPKRKSSDPTESVRALELKSPVETESSARPESPVRLECSARTESPVKMESPARPESPVKSESPAKSEIIGELVSESQLRLKNSLKSEKSESPKPNEQKSNSIEAELEIHENQKHQINNSLHQLSSSVQIILPSEINISELKSSSSTDAEMDLEVANPIILGNPVKSSSPVGSESSSKPQSPLVLGILARPETECPVRSTNSPKSECSKLNEQLSNPIQVEELEIHENEIHQNNISLHQFSSEQNLIPSDEINVTKPESSSSTDTEIDQELANLITDDEDDDYEV